LKSTLGSAERPQSKHDWAVGPDTVSTVGSILALHTNGIPGQPGAPAGMAGIDLPSGLVREFGMSAGSEGMPLHAGSYTRFHRHGWRRAYSSTHRTKRPPRNAPET